MVGRYRWVPVVIAAAVMAGSGCSSDPGAPTVVPSLSPSPTPIAVSTTTELQRVEAVVRQYYALLNQPTSAQTALQLRRLMTTRCECRASADSMEAIANQHQHYFGSNRLRSLSGHLDGSASADVLVGYDYTRGGIADGSGHVIKTTPGRVAVTVNVRLVRVAGRWLINQIEVVSKGRPS